MGGVRWKTGRELLRNTLFPVLLFGGVALAVGLRELGAGELVAVVASTFSVAIALLFFQQVLPFEPTWRGTPSDFGIDLAHLISTGLAGELWRAMVFGLVIQGSVVLAGWWGGSLWPSHLPWLLQVGLALLIGDLGAYWAHRSMHLSPTLWRLHAMHHSTERMYVLAASRSHPLNFIFAWAAAAVPLLLLGCPESVLLVIGAFTAVHGMLQHANVDMAHGLFNQIFATADLHRWHHSASFEESNTNFGSNLILWDRVFGTYFLPEKRSRPERLGIEGVSMPENVWAHWASPFLLERWTLEDLEELDDFTLEAALPSATAGEEGHQEHSPEAYRAGG